MTAGQWKSSQLVSVFCILRMDFIPHWCPKGTNDSPFFMTTVKRMFFCTLHTSHIHKHIHTHTLTYTHTIYLVLFVLQVAHKASTRACQWCRSAETRSRRPHVQPFSFISLSTVLLQVSLGRPLFLWPSGVHRRAILVKAIVCWRSTCPIHRQRLRLTWVEMGSISALRCSPSLVMVFGQ